MKRRTGWTLIELICFMGLASMLVGLVYAAFNRSYRLFLMQERALGEVRSSLTLERALERDVRSAREARVEGTTLTLRVGEGQVAYEYDAQTGALWRSEVGSVDAVKRSPFTFALTECSFEVSGRTVTVTYRRRNTHAAPQAARLPARRARVSMWVEE